MNSMPALERLRRLLVVIPWVVEADGPLITEVAERFDYEPEELIDDLERIVFFVGVHPFTPDCLVEVALTEDRVWIAYADWFRRPMRLSHPEAAALSAAGRAVASLMRVQLASDTELGPLERALTKLSRLSDISEGAVEIRLDPPGALLAGIRGAVEAGEVIQINYHSFHRDAFSTREVEPHRCYADKGHWYVVAHCRAAGGQRVFRLDRIRGWEVTGERFSIPDRSNDHVEGIPLDGRFPEVVLELDASTRWVIEEYPHSGLEVIDGGRIRVRLPVASDRWLERLLVRLGPEATLVEGEDGLGLHIRSAAASRILSRYSVRSGTGV